MTDSKRIGLLLKRLAIQWKQCPELRLGQLLINACGVRDDLYYVEDDKLVMSIDSYLDVYRGDDWL